MSTSQKTEKILIAVDDSKYSDIAASYGATLARKLEAKIAFVHVNELPVVPPLASDPLVGEPNLMVPELMEVQEEAGKSLFDRLRQEYGIEDTPEFFTRTGMPKDEILDVADEWGAGMIVLGTHGRTGFDHFISGSVAEKIARHAKCPVLIVPVEQS